jgi:signal transduction histidine kinase
MPGGSAPSWNGTCIDITDRKRAEQEAQRMSEELAALNEEMAASNEELRAANEADRPLHVRITCYELETHHVLSVEDNGLGMDMRQEEKIFALFKRLHNHVQGTGIGRYIVKKMLENAGGGIEVESQVGVGSTFRVYFKR